MKYYATIKKIMKRILGPVYNKLGLLIRERREIRIRQPIIENFKLLERSLEQFQLYEDFSLRKTQDHWKTKWEAASKRVLFVTPKDYSGSFFKWAKSLNDYSSYSTRIVAFTKHKFGYETDIIIPRAIPQYMQGDIRIAFKNILKLINETDIVHFKDEQELFHELHGKTKKTFLTVIYEEAKKQNKKIVFTAYGGYARKYKNNESYRKFVKNFDARIVMTPDLNYPWFDGFYIPHSINMNEFPYLWIDGTLLSHSPSMAIRKGTESFLYAIQSIAGITLDIIHNVSYAECLKRKKSATLFFDQAGRERSSVMGTSEPIGWYGNSAIEAMAFGIPTIAHLSEESFQGAKRAGKDIKSQCPIINVGCEDPISIRQAILQFFKLTKEERQSLSMQTRIWVEKFHDNKVVSQELSAIYDQLM
jgi:hypothetical protein